ncbi:MAG: hypothetical protein HZB26_25320 [Candidatus Hydrogenedentes bacterium]|nr:hypothetical protein [Candidatus Hydrogenedentota bacterium]
MTAVELTTDSATVETKSRVRVWWLSQFGGYSVRTARLRPRVNWLGRIAYDQVWLLSPSVPLHRGAGVR